MEFDLSCKNDQMRTSEINDLRICQNKLTLAALGFDLSGVESMQLMN